MMSAPDRAARMEQQAEELEGQIAVHAMIADINLMAAHTLREKQRDLRALADLHRASEMPAMRPISTALPRVEQRVS